MLTSISHYRPSLRRGGVENAGVENEGVECVSWWGRELKDKMHMSMRNNTETAFKFVLQRKKCNMLNHKRI